MIPNWLQIGSTDLRTLFQHFNLVIARAKNSALSLRLILQDFGGHLSFGMKIDRLFYSPLENQNCCPSLDCRFKFLDWRKQADYALLDMVIYLS